MTRPLLRMLIAVVVATLLGGCVAGGDPRLPIPSRLVPAPAAATRLVVLLPGRGDDLEGLVRHHAAELVQRQWPDADVLLTGLTLPYYRAGRAVPRLDREIVRPALQHYRQLWLAGISLGGLGALLYDQAHPGAVHGLLLLSPYLGDASIRHEIEAAGGLAAWQPGPRQPMGPDTFQRELWRYLQHWRQDPRRVATTWLAYGDRERFRAPIELMSPLLPPTHVLMLPGHHDWTLWSTALPALLRRADRSP